MIVETVFKKAALLVHCTLWSLKNVQLLLICTQQLVMT